jgi:hypothetical protein
MLIAACIHNCLAPAFVIVDFSLPRGVEQESPSRRRGGFRSLAPGSRRENTRSSVGGRKTREQVFVSIAYPLGALVSNSDTQGYRNSRKVGQAK